MRISRFLTVIVTLCALLPACHHKESSESDNLPFKDQKVIVAYFSATGHTKLAAHQLSDLTGGELFEIQPLKPYTTEDIDYNDQTSRCWEENRDSTIRPALVSFPDCLDSTDIIFVGYPIWWEKEPLPVYTFIENPDLKGKTIIPFATSATSSIGQSVESLKSLRNDVTWCDGILMNEMSDNELSDRLEKITNQLKMSTSSSINK